MELVFLVALVLLVLCIVLPLRAAYVASSLRDRVERLERHMEVLHREIRGLRAVPLHEPGSLPEPRIQAPAPGPQTYDERGAAMPPPLPPPATPSPPARVLPPERNDQQIPPATPEPAEAMPRPVPPVPVVAARPFQFEQFLGKKLFAWVGGLGLFIGVLLLVKFAFDAGWFPPAARITMGFITGAALLAGGLRIRREELRILAHTLAATGILILYGVTFAAHGVYHFSAFSTLPAFALMALITGVAFLVALRLPALTVALLGMLGGFLTPLLLSTGEDRPIALFSYIALLDAGLILLAVRGRWPFLAALAAGATCLLQWGWSARFFHVGQYDIGTATLIPMGISLGFGALFTAGAVATRHRDAGVTAWLSGTASVLWITTLLVGFYYLLYAGIAHRPWLLFGYLFVANAGALYTTNLLPPDQSRQLPRLAGAITFLLLTVWLCAWMKPESLGTGLALIFVFAMLNAVVPLVMSRWRGVAGMVPLAPWAPVGGIVLTLLPVILQREASFLVWPVLAALNLTVIAFVARGQRLLTLAASVCLTLFAAVVWLLKTQVSPGGFRDVLLLAGLFAAFFTGAGVWLLKKRPDTAADLDGRISPQGLTAMTAFLPWLLVLMSLVRFPVPDPSLVYGLSLVLAVILLGLGRWFRLPVLAPVTALCVLAVEALWWAQNFRGAIHSSAITPGYFLTWTGLLAGLFLAWPFTHRAEKPHALTWTALALSSIGHGILTYLTVRTAFPAFGMLGLVPAAWAVILTGVLLAFLRTVPAGSPGRTASLAWLGGTGLLFITLIFPAQFERHWLTICWAMEGAALCWLHRRLRHPGLLTAATLLLGAVFVRLILNPAVIHAYHRDGTPVWNWLLYTYGLAALSYFLAARWLPADARTGALRLRPLFTGMGGVLLFALLNLEIADWFTRPDMRTIDLKNHGVFAQSMVTSIGWALFALTTLTLGLWKKAPAARYAGAGLLAVTLVKLFVHDLSAMESIYRIAAFIAVSILTLVAAWLYQRFLTPPAAQPSPPTTPPDEIS